MIEIKNLDGTVLVAVNAESLIGANLIGANLRVANLAGAYLRGANLRGADLRAADLRGANLTCANLTGAYLSGADLTCAYLAGAYLAGADLRDAGMRGADLRGAYLSCANLRGANLRDVNLRGADLRGAETEESTIWPHFQICPEQGAFVAWKKTSTGVIKISVPRDAQRTSSLVGRKCRASHVKVLSGPGCGGESPTMSDTQITYTRGTVVYADNFNPDPKVECTSGIHFFMTRKEAEEY